MRATPILALVAVAAPLTAQTPPKRTVQLTGFVLVNGFFTNARVKQ